MASATYEVKVYILIDTDGNYVTANNEDSLSDRWDEEIGGVPLGSRVLSVKLDVEVPGTTELLAHVPAKSTKIQMEVKG